MASSTLFERITAWRGTSAQVKLYFRRLRDGEIPLTTDTMATFEGAMFAIDAEAADLLAEASRLVRETGEVVQGALDLIHDAEDRQVFPEPGAVAEIVQKSREHRARVRQDEPVYLPSEHRGWLEDMATPNGNVVPLRQPLGRSAS